MIMIDWVIHESSLRLGSFLVILAVIAWCEVKLPRRRLTATKGSRWRNHIGLSVCNTLLLRLVFPVAAVGCALMAEQHSWGVFHQPWLKGLSPPFTILISLILLDLLIWTQHLVFHRVTWLWRLHRLHHSDLDIDTSTALRFHPLEIVLSMAIKAAAVIALGIPAVAVIIFEIVLNGMALFNHGNIRIPVSVDKCLRWLIVTPDMHRIHHSTALNETNSNYGFNLSLWDRLFGTYRKVPKRGHENMSIGLESFRSPQEQRFYALLIQPFVKGRSETE